MSGPRCVCVCSAACFFFFVPNCKKSSFGVGMIFLLFFPFANKFSVGVDFVFFFFFGCKINKNIFWLGGCGGLSLCIAFLIFSSPGPRLTHKQV